MTIGEDEAQRDGLMAAADYVKYTLALATGSLVFSAGLLSDEQITLTEHSSTFLFWSWIVFGFSITCGVVFLAIVPGKLASKSYALNDNWLRIPTMLHQFAFVVGIVLLGLTLLTAL